MTVLTRAKHHCARADNFHCFRIAVEEYYSLHITIVLVFVFFVPNQKKRIKERTKICLSRHNCGNTLFDDANSLFFRYFSNDVTKIPKKRV